MGGKSRFDSWRRRHITVGASSEVPSPAGAAPWNCAERGVVGRGGGWGLPTAQRLPREETESRLAAPHPALAKRSAASPGRADCAAEPGARGPGGSLGRAGHSHLPAGTAGGGTRPLLRTRPGAERRRPGTLQPGSPPPRRGGHKPFYLGRLPGMGTRRGGWEMWGPAGEPSPGLGEGLPEPQRCPTESRAPRTGVSSRPLSSAPCYLEPAGGGAQRLLTARHTPPAGR